jgi:hypothetical protein
MKMGQKQCSETSAIKHHTPENIPKGYTQQYKMVLLIQVVAELKTWFNRNYLIFNAVKTGVIFFITDNHSFW